MFKKIIIASLFSLFSFSDSYSQMSSEIANQIQLFIESTTQMPFSAKVANKNGIVRVRVLLVDSLNTPYYQISKSLTTDCNNEALRVIKLVNVRNIKQLLGERKSGIFEVLFENTSFFGFKDGYKIEYINDKYEIIENTNNAKYIRKYPVDSTSGFIKGNVDYYKNDRNSAINIGYYQVKIDSTERHSLEVLENEKDTLAVITRSQKDYDSDFPNNFGNYFSNGQLARKSSGNITYFYYPNGRIKSINTDLNEIENIKKWYANGQFAYEKNIEFLAFGEREKYLFVFDTLGNQLLNNGNGKVELFDRNKLKVVGELANGYKSGTWNGISQNGDTIFTETFKDGDFKSGLNLKNNVKYNKEHQIAEFIGGQNALGSFLQKNLNYPINAMKKGVQGKVFVTFSVCTDGSLCDFDVLKSAGKELNSEAIRVVKLQSGKWKPGKNRGENIKSKFNLPISFILE